MRPWRFIDIDDAELRDTIGSLNTEREPYHVSPQLIAVCANI